MSRHIFDKSETGYPKDVIPKLISIVDNEISQKYVKGFYIGRTADYKRRYDEHGCGIMILLYKTDSDENAITVEDYLINAFISHDKCRNKAESGGGGVSQEESGGIVYLCIFCDIDKVEFLMRLLEDKN